MWFKISIKKISGKLNSNLHLKWKISVTILKFQSSALIMLKSGAGMVLNSAEFESYFKVHNFGRQVEFIR